MRPLGLILGLSLAGCGGPSPGAFDAGLGDAAVGCPANPPDGGQCVRTVDGKLVDEAGQPIAGALMSVCALACFFGMTGSDGAFSVAVHANIAPDEFALLAHVRPDHASFYAPLPEIRGEVGTYAAPIVAARLPASGPPIAMDKSAQTLTSGDLTLTLAAGTDVQLDVEDVELGALGQQLRVVSFDPKRSPFSAGGASADALYGIAPFEAVLSQKAQVSFANAGAHPPGTVFEVLAQGTIVGGAPPAGRWKPVGTARVAMDGQRINLDPGGGVTVLSWIALRKQ